MILLPLIVCRPCNKFVLTPEIISIYDLINGILWVLCHLFYSLSCHFMCSAEETDKNFLFHQRRFFYVIFSLLYKENISLKWFQCTLRLFWLSRKDKTEELNAMCCWLFWCTCDTSACLTHIRLSTYHMGISFLCLCLSLCVLDITSLSYRS